MSGPPGEQVLLGLGSNLGERWAQLADALATLVSLDAGLIASSVFETEPVGGPAGQGPYLNLVAALVFTASPLEMLRIAQRLEREAGRVRAERFGPRTLDVDLLFFGATTSDDEELILPHPRALERAFVLAPLEEVAPERCDPGWRERFGGPEAVARTVRRVGAILPRTTPLPATPP